jgi:hypothetical protein
VGTEFLERPPVLRLDAPVKVHHKPLERAFRLAAGLVRLGELVPQIGDGKGAVALDGYLDQFTLARILPVGDERGSS